MQHSVVPSTGQALYVGATTVVGLIVDARMTYGRAKSMTFLSVYKQRMDALVRMDGPAGNCNSNGGLRLHWHCDSPAFALPHSYYGTVQQCKHTIQIRNDKCLQQFLPPPSSAL